MVSILTEESDELGDNLSSCWLQSTLNHQSQMEYCSWNTVPLGQRNEKKACGEEPTQTWNIWHRLSEPLSAKYSATRITNYTMRCWRCSSNAQASVTSEVSVLTGEASWAMAVREAGGGEDGIVQARHPWHRRHQHVQLASRRQQPVRLGETLKPNWSYFLINEMLNITKRSEWLHCIFLRLVLLGPGQETD